MSSKRRQPDGTVKETCDLRPLLKEPDAKIVVRRNELIKLMIEADKALDGDSNDAEHAALYELREAISDIVEDDDRRLTTK